MNVFSIAIPCAAAVTMWGGQPTSAQTPAKSSVATGVVFHDVNGDGARGEGEPGVGGVGVSNGREVVLTDDAGRYEIPVAEDTILFVIKPRGWRTRVDELNIPRFYYIHKPAGSPRGLEHAGVAPTGPLPESVDFALTKAEEPERFTFIAIGDPQPRNIEEVDYFSHDVIEEVIGSRREQREAGEAGPAFVVGLGDIAFDDLSVYEPLTQALAHIGALVWCVHGNHDMNYDVETDDLADETWERVFGPATYAFNVGPAHFVVLDNVEYQGAAQDRKYVGRIGPAGLEFIAADLAHVARETPVVLFMHIPLTETMDRDRLFDLIEDRPHTLSISAHRHTQQHVHLGPEDGWDGAAPHHHLVAATGSGSWWSGAPDEEGIPHATMADGAPNGYTIVTMDGAAYAMRYKAARRPADHQMTIFAPNEVAQADLPATEVLVNVFAGSPKSVVEMRIGEGSSWTALRLEAREDPHQQRMKALEESETPPPGRKIPNLRDSTHIWVGALPPGLAPGTHLIEVRTTDQFGQAHHGRRLFRVK